MTETRRIFRVVYYNEDTEEFCQCRDGFWKTCPLRVASNLPCQESVLSITPVDRSGPPDPAGIIGSIDPKLKHLSDKLRSLSKKAILK